MDEFINYLLQFGHLNQQQIDLVKSKLKNKEIARNGFHLEAGKVPKELIFITEGIMRLCYYNHKGEEITKYFADENQMVGDIANFNLGTPASEYLQAITDCTYLAITKRDMDELSQTIVVWDAMMSKIAAKCLTDKVNKISTMMAEDATERYLNFLQNFPNIANRIPMSYVASFLGITQSSLSRIRKNIKL
jgi:CRP-like cAMP-binding protein